MFTLNQYEEVLAIIVALVIIFGFAYSTYKEIQTTIAEEREKIAEKKEIEDKVNTLIDYLDAKTELMEALNSTNKKLEKNKK